MNLEQVLTEAKLSQQALADRIVAEFGGTLHQTAVSHWKKRGIPLERKVQIARVTGIPLKRLAPDLDS